MDIRCEIYAEKSVTYYRTFLFSRYHTAQHIEVIRWTVMADVFLS